MESILESFHLEPSSFRSLLSSTGGIVAGSAAVAAYGPNIFTPNDLDIWVPSALFVIPRDPTEDFPPPVQYGYGFLYSYFLKQHGYTEVFPAQQSDLEYTSDPIFSILQYIQRFQHTDGSLIQVIHCTVPMYDVLDTFDLSVAKTWWDPRTGLHTADPVAMELRQMYRLRPTRNAREEERIRKYEARRFELIE